MFAFAFLLLPPAAEMPGDEPPKPPNTAAASAASAPLNSASNAKVVSDTAIAVAGSHGVVAQQGKRNHHVNFVLTSDFENLSARFGSVYIWRDYY